MEPKFTDLGASMTGPWCTVVKKKKDTHTRSCLADYPLEQKCGLRYTEESVPISPEKFVFSTFIYVNF